MKKQFLSWAALLSAITLFSSISPFSPRNSQQAIADDGKITITLLQLNDVYEISPLEKGRFGGFARIAELRKQLVKENPNTYTLLAGDFLSPSAIGTLSYEGKGIRGRQMVEMMNAVPVDLVTFGNHEFDLSESALTDRINESTFTWISANISHKTANSIIPFARKKNDSSEFFLPAVIKTFTDADSTIFNIGFLGLTLHTPGLRYVVYEDYLAAAGRTIDMLKGRCDIIVALTHLELRDDKKLAEKFPDISFIIGGHEHENSYTRVGHAFIAKADANAKTAYVHSVEFDKSSKKLDVNSRLVVINEAIDDDPAMAGLVNKWNRRADSALLAKGIVPCEPVANLPEPFDGREVSVRTKKTNLTHAVAAAMSMAAKDFKPDFSLYNGGSIRLDDVLQGSITQYDLFRVLPFGGTVVMAQMRGSLIDSLLTISDTSKGNGCFLQHDRITRRVDSTWLINNQKIIRNKIYRAAVSDFLISGGEPRMSFLKQGYPGLKLDTPRIAGAPIDLLRSVNNYFRLTYKPAPHAGELKGVPCY